MITRMLTAVGLHFESMGAWNGSVEKQPSGDQSARSVFVNAYPEVGLRIPLVPAAGQTARSLSHGNDDVCDGK